MLEIVTICILYNELREFLIDFLNYEQHVDESRVGFYWSLLMKNLLGRSRNEETRFHKDI